MFFINKNIDNGQWINLVVNLSLKKMGETRGMLHTSYMFLQGNALINHVKQRERKGGREEASWFWMVIAWCQKTSFKADKPNNRKLKKKKGR